MMDVTDEAMISTFITLLDTMINPYPDLSDVEYERYFNFAAIWSFAGSLDADHRESFSNWWRQEFEQHIDYPEDGLVFDYMVDSESREFCKWADTVPAYTGTPHEGIPHEAFVHSVNTEQLTYLLGLLTDVGKPVMLVGESGCGKTSIVTDRIKTVCSGEVAEVLALTVNANRFTNAKQLYHRLDERVEWKHGKTYVPKGNKRLLCLVDDLNLSQVDKHGNQSAVELVRQHIDDGGFYNPDNYNWKYLKNVTYVTTVNPKSRARVPKLSQRLLRHFAVFGCPYPRKYELYSIFSTLIQTHFITPETSSTVTISASMANHLGINDEKIQNVIREEEEALKVLLCHIVHVNLELQERMRTMFLPTATRCHYVFTMRDLGTIFRNLCLSLQPGCVKDNLMYLWRHECNWVYGHRMVNEVDYERYRHSFNTAVKKEFTNIEEIDLLTNPREPLFSSLVEQDSGVVTAGNPFGVQIESLTDIDNKTDLFRPEFDLRKVRELMFHGLEEYNKAHPRIKLSMYRVALELVCRLARTLSAPHEVSHCILVAEGCPGRCTVMAQLAANLSGYSVFQINPSPMASTRVYKTETFKNDLVTAYITAGVKGEKILFLLHEEELVDDDFLVFLGEFVVSGTSISNLFSYEEQTTIINSIRTEVTQAGLTYTREVAWEFFIKTVRSNFRICFIASSGEGHFQRICREYPALVQNVNVFWLPHWSKKQLVRHAIYHLKGIGWMNNTQRENVAHMLASFHIVLRQQDGQEKTSGEYKHITNTSYEKFVERFISLANAKYGDIQGTHKGVTASLQQIQNENTQAAKLKKQLEHEKIVLEERRAGTVKILSQIGQDTAITEQQVKIVKSQLERIQRLKKLLPEYQVAHERSIYKATAIIKDTKKVVAEMDIDALHELRAMQKPIVDIEDLMASIILILKNNPSADLTWQKGAKRQMANLERFMEELMGFDDNVLPESTLNLVEPSLKKASFDAETMERKTSNKACASLCKWVKGVVRYNRMMLSKVKPLHNKVEQTTQAVDNAEHKMSTLENKRKALEIRLADLAKGFEEATIDKNDQEEKTIKMDKMLETAARLKKILRKEHLRLQQIFDSIEHRFNAINGGTVMAAAFATYLGPYHYNFRRLMLTVHWPNCLRERGIPLVIDSVDFIRGRVVDFCVRGLKTASGASGLTGVDIFDEELPFDEAEQAEEDEMQEEQEEGEKEVKDEKNVQIEEGNEPGEKELKLRMHEKNKDVPELTADPSGDKEENRKIRVHMKNRKISPRPPATADPSSKEPGPGLEGIQEADIEASEMHKDFESVSSVSDATTLHFMSPTEYTEYVRSIVKLLVGEQVLAEWVRKDWEPHQIENAAIVQSSWQRPPLLIDPYGEAVKRLKSLTRSLSKKNLVILNMDTRSDPQVILSIEKGIMKGHHILLQNCDDHIDSMVMPLIHHCNTNMEKISQEEARMIRFCGRRILCQPSFRLYLSTSRSHPEFSPLVASSTTVVNYGSSNETLVDDLLTRSFAKLRPNLYKERRLTLKAIYMQKNVLHQISEIERGKQERSQHNWTEREVEFVSDVAQKTVQVAKKLKQTQAFLVNVVDQLKEEFRIDIARRGATLYSVIKSLRCLRKEYQFPLSYFQAIFDDAIEGEFPEEYADEEPTDVQFDEDTISVHNVKTSRHGVVSNSSHAGSAGTRHTGHSQQGDKDQEAEGDYGNDFEEDDENSQKKNTSVITQGKDVTEDAEKIPTLDIPEFPTLPSMKDEDYIHFNEKDNRTKIFMDKLTTAVFDRVRQSLYDEDALLFATMLSLNIQLEYRVWFSEEELSLLLQGNPGLGNMQLTLEDFECDSPPPTWLTQERWEDILALSVLPGPLDSVCAHIAEHSDTWKAWYDLHEPEKEDLPIQKEEGDKDEGEELVIADDDKVTGFHKLLVIRFLRPDRMPAAMSSYVAENFAFNLVKQPEPTLEDIKRTMGMHYHGILVLLPPDGETDGHLPSTLNMHDNSSETLVAMAESLGVPVQHCMMGEGCEMTVHQCLDDAEKNNGWCIIDNLHVAPDTFYKEFYQHLVRLHHAEESSEGSPNNFTVWITTKPSDKIPVYLLKHLHKLSWEFVGTQLLQPKEEVGQGQADPELPELDFNHGSLSAILSQALMSAFSSVNPNQWELISSESQTVKLLAYGVGLVHGMLMSRQMFGTVALSQWYPLSGIQMNQAIECLYGQTLKAGDSQNIENVCDVISQVVYGNMMVTQWDTQYVKDLLYHVLGTLASGEVKELMLGQAKIPVPGSDVVPAEYGNWLLEQIGGEAITTEALSLHPSIEKDYNETSSIKFLHNLDQLHETQNRDTPGFIKEETINTTILHQNIDTCLEKLPPLLELGQSSAGSGHMDMTFPYHRPSIVSIATASATQMPESLGHVLLQECLWFNSQTCYIRQNLHDLLSCLVGGPDSFPESLKGTALSLQKDNVPMIWIHPNDQPGTHSLDTWLKDLKKRYCQFYSWIKSHMVPTLDEDGQIKDDGLSRGRLTTVWLSGLVNPPALFTALRQEKAVINGCYIDQIVLECHVGPINDTDEGGFYITDLFLQGALWEGNRQCLAPATSYMTLMPCIYIKAITISDLEDDQQQAPKYSCPVFMNKGRQVLVAHLPLNSGEAPPHHWSLAGTALILDEGIPEGQPRKPRQTLPIKAIPYKADLDGEEVPRSASTRQAHSSQLFDGPEPSFMVEDEEDEEEEARLTRQSDQSHQSQLSYKPISPKAPPLPPQLQMQRSKIQMDTIVSEQQPSEPNKEKHKLSGSRESIASKGSKHSDSSQKSGGQRSKPGSRTSKRSVTKETASANGEAAGAERAPSVKSETKSVGKLSLKQKDQDQRSTSQQSGKSTGAASQKSQTSKKSAASKAGSRATPSGDPNYEPEY